jgi:hypothetical protein
MKNSPFIKAVLLLATATMSLTAARTQTCPTSGTITLNSNPNTYYPGSQATVNAGATSIVIGNASTFGYGTTPISAYDIVLMPSSSADFNGWATRTSRRTRPRNSGTMV